MRPLQVGQVTVPARAMVMTAVRSGGPGGQNVNKVASKVELHVELELVEGLSPSARARLAALAAPRVDAQGRLFVTSQRSRDQRLNLEDARQKVATLIAQAMKVPRRRRATRPTTASVERRIGDKKRHAQKKAGRRGLDD